MGKLLYGLSPKHRRFCEEYLKDLVGAKAAIRAGYSAKTAYQQGYALLRKPEIAEAIAELVQERSERTQITADMVLRKLARVAFGNIYDFMRVGENGDPYIDFSNLTREQATALSEFTVANFKVGRGKDARQVRRVRVKTHDKIRALIALGKHLGLFTKQGRRDRP